MLFKLNQELELVWQSPIFLDDSQRFSETTRRVVPTRNKDGYIGYTLSNKPDFSGSTIETLSTIFKIDNTGEVVWVRRFNLFSDSLPAAMQPEDHLIYDMRRAHDGGLILSGSTTVGDGDSFRQLGYVIKLDTAGCLIPGCDVTSAVESEPERTGPAILIGPNPVSVNDGLLHFMIRNGTDEHREYSLNIVDQNGRVVKIINRVDADVQHLLPLMDWSSGIYFLQFTDDRGGVTVEKVVVH